MNILKTQGEIIGELKGINRRLDVSNSRTSKNEVKIEESQDKIHTIQNKLSGVLGQAIGAGAVVGLIIGIAGLMIK